MNSKACGSPAIFILIFLLQALILSEEAKSEDLLVDIALVLAADASSSMTGDELKLQRNGYADALQSPAVLAAIRSGPNRRIAVTYLEWSGEGVAQVVVKWTVVDSSASIEQVARAIRSYVSVPSRKARTGRTSISYALSLSAYQFQTLPWITLRRVIDVSGNGVNNDGGAVDAARARALDFGITINGLPIGNDVDDGESIADYYARAVIGGDNAFIEPAASIRDFQIAL